VARCGEFLPLRCEQADWVLFNVTRTIDALDIARSEITYFKHSGNVMDFVTIVFKPERLRGELMFRIPQRSASDIFVTDTFADLVVQHGLKGFDLRPVWSDEQPVGQAAA
jgi:hypothetical protein